MIEPAALKYKLKEQIIQYLNLKELTPEDIKDDALLFGGDLDLDSIDSLEIVVLLEREYGLKINNANEGRKILIDINRMAAYIMEHKKDL
jgi:acyl carrier protein